MKQEIKLPEIADNVVSGFLSRILVKVGDVIAKDQSIIEIETDKAATDIPSPLGGKIVDIKVNAGDEVRVGQTIMIVEVATDSVVIPTEVGTPSQTAKASAESGMVSEKLPVQSGAVRHEVPASAGMTTPLAASLPLPTSAFVPASPSVRRFARELGLDISRVKGSGPGGRISDDDVKAHAKDVIQSPKTSQFAGYAEVPDFSKWGPVEAQPMSRIRTITAESTVNSWQTIPQVVQFEKG